MGDKTALIFGSVAYPDWRFLAPLQGQNLTVLCADGGIRCAALAGFCPGFLHRRRRLRRQRPGPARHPAPGGKGPDRPAGRLRGGHRQGASNLILTACTGAAGSSPGTNLQLLETLAKRGVGL